MCSADYLLGTTVTLTASPAAGSTFTGWSAGGCAGAGQCAVTIDSAKSVTATFTLEKHTLTVTKGWSGGGCLGTGQCTVTLDSAKSVTATFAKHMYTLTVLICTTNCDNGHTGPGTVTSSDGFINCAGNGGPTTTGTCSHQYEHGTLVTLTASAHAAATAAFFN